MKFKNMLMIKIVVCECGKEWQMWRGNLGLRAENYSFHCICGAHLVHRNRDQGPTRKCVSVEKRSK